MQNKILLINYIMINLYIDSLFNESELDIDDSAIKESEERTIDDFEDVDENDKTLFKMWNYFIRENKK